MGQVNMLFFVLLAASVVGSWSNMETEWQLLGKDVAQRLEKSMKVANPHYANKFAETFNEMLKLFPHFVPIVEHKDLADQYADAITNMNNATLLDGYYAMRKLMKFPNAPYFTFDTSKCPKSCTEFGNCNEELTRCDCPRGREGQGCEKRVPVRCDDYCAPEDRDTKECFHLRQGYCVNACNKRGICLGGFCHCFPGFFGADCSLSMAKDNKPELLAGLNYTLNSNPMWPRVYVHELPPSLNIWRPLWLDRPVGMIIWERLLTGGHRVADPAQADFFYIPVFLRACPLMDQLHNYLKDPSQPVYKWLARNNGSDHFITATGDWGRCEGAGHKEFYWMNRTIYVTHWGLTVERKFPGRPPQALTGFNTCHYPQQDIVVPPINHEVITTWTYSPWYNPKGGGPKDMPNRTTLASFAGGICGWRDARDPPCEMTEYSLNVRASLYTLFHGKKDYVVEKTVGNIAMMMVGSKFCFGPPGHGWGRRAAMAVVLGCVPVVIQDDVLQGYEPNLNWTDFGLRIAEKDMNFTDAILRNITDKHYEYMQSKLKCAAKHVFYTTAYGSLFGDDGFFDAFHTLLQLLMARKRHPETPQEKLAVVDPMFRDFMACSKELHDDEAEPLCWFTIERNKSAPFCNHNIVTHAYGDRKYPVGGAPCIGAPDFAHCRRYG